MVYFNRVLIGRLVRRFNWNKKTFYLEVLRMQKFQSLFVFQNFTEINWGINTYIVSESVPEVFILNLHWFCCHWFSGVTFFQGFFLCNSGRAIELWDGIQYIKQGTWRGIAESSDFYLISFYSVCVCVCNRRKPVCDIDPVQNNVFSLKSS